MMGRPLTVGGKQVPIATFGWPGFIGPTCSSLPFVRAGFAQPATANFRRMLNMQAAGKTSSSKVLPRRCPTSVTVSRVTLRVPDGIEGGG